MKILVLAAGGSSAFEKAGYPYPKNLVEIHGKPLLQLVLENCAIPGAGFIVVLPKEEAAKYHTDQVVRLLFPDATVLLAPTPTSGAACTALLAVEHIDSEDPLLIVNGDQILQADHATIVEEFLLRGLDGGIPVFEDVHPRYSFVKVNEEGFVVEAAEKRPISKLATAGRYFFRKGSTFVRSAQQMILKDAHVEGNFFVCPAYNEAILDGAKIGISRVHRNQFHILASPQGVEEYLNNRSDGKADSIFDAPKVIK
jgi:dTDP-glucose pyrophosphorylase